MQNKKNSDNIEHTSDATTSEPNEQQNAEVVTVKFRNAGKQYDFATNSLPLKCNDTVVVETSRGRALGTVVRAPRLVDIRKRSQELKKVLRTATEADINMTRISRAKEAEAFDFCVERIKKRNLPMNLVKADYLFDGSKILFHFTAENRIDFRELVKDLAHHFHTRIEMRQIGVRDEAKLLGGLGICGRELCCSTFITEFQPVSVKMAKQQGLALNPSKISGQCGRLLCCLGYEYETYCKLAKKLPKPGRKINFEGQEATVAAINILGQSVTLRLENKTVEVPLEHLFPSKDDENKGSEDKNVRPKEPKAPQAQQDNTRGTRRTPQASQQSKSTRTETTGDETGVSSDTDKKKNARQDGKSDAKKSRSNYRKGRSKYRSSQKRADSGTKQEKTDTSGTKVPSPQAKSEAKGDAGTNDKNQDSKNLKKRPPRRRNKRRPKPKPKA